LNLQKVGKFVLGLVKMMCLVWKFLMAKIWLLNIILIFKVIILLTLDRRLLLIYRFYKVILFFQERYWIFWKRKQIEAKKIIGFKRKIKAKIFFKILKQKDCIFFWKQLEILKVLYLLRTNKLVKTIKQIIKAINFIPLIKLAQNK